MEARATSNGLRISQLGRSTGYKAVRAMRVTIGGSEPEKSIAACGEVVQNDGSAWRQMQRSVEDRILGFSRGRP